MFERRRMPQTTEAAGPIRRPTGSFVAHAAVAAISLAVLGIGGAGVGAGISSIAWADPSPRVGSAADSSALRALAPRVVDVSADDDSVTLFLRPPMRGDMSEPSMSFARFVRHSHRLLLSVPPLKLPANAMVAMELRSEDGKLLARSEIKQSALAARKPVLVSDTTRPLAPGRYSIRLAERVSARSHAAPRDSAVYAFELRGGTF